MEGPFEIVRKYKKKKNRQKSSHFFNGGSLDQYNQRLEQNEIAFPHTTTNMNKILESGSKDSRTGVSTEIQMKEKNNLSLIRNIDEIKLHTSTSQNKRFRQQSNTSLQRASNQLISINTHDIFAQKDSMVKNTTVNVSPDFRRDVHHDLSGYSNSENIYGKNSKNEGSFDQTQFSDQYMQERGIKSRGGSRFEIGRHQRTTSKELFVNTSLIQQKTFRTSNLTPNQVHQEIIGLASTSVTNQSMRPMAEMENKNHLYRLNSQFDKSHLNLPEKQSEFPSISNSITSKVQTVGDKKFSLHSTPKNLQPGYKDVKLIRYLGAYRNDLLGEFQVSQKNFKKYFDDQRKQQNNSSFHIEDIQHKFMMKNFTEHFEQWEQRFQQEYKKLHTRIFVQRITDFKQFEDLALCTENIKKQATEMKKNITVMSNSSKQDARISNIETRYKQRIKDLNVLIQSLLVIQNLRHQIEQYIEKNKQDLDNETLQCQLTAVIEATKQKFQNDELFDTYVKNIQIEIDKIRETGKIVVSALREAQTLQQRLRVGISDKLKNKLADNGRLSPTSNNEIAETYMQIISETKKVLNQLYGVSQMNVISNKLIERINNVQDDITKEKSHFFSSISQNSLTLLNSMEVIILNNIHLNADKVEFSSSIEYLMPTVEVLLEVFTSKKGVYEEDWEQKEMANESNIIGNEGTMFSQMNQNNQSLTISINQDKLSQYHLTQKNFNRMTALLLAIENQYNEIHLTVPEKITIGEEGSNEIFEKMLLIFDRFNVNLREITGIISSLQIQYLGTQDFNNIINYNTDGNFQDTSTQSNYYSLHNQLILNRQQQGTIDHNSNLENSSVFKDGRKKQSTIHNTPSGQNLKNSQFLRNPEMNFTFAKKLPAVQDQELTYVWDLSDLNLFLTKNKLNFVQSFNVPPPPMGRVQQRHRDLLIADYRYLQPFSRYSNQIVATISHNQLNNLIQTLALNDNLLMMVDFVFPLFKSVASVDQYTGECGPGPSSEQILKAFKQCSDFMINHGNESDCGKVQNLFDHLMYNSLHENIDLNDYKTFQEQIFQTLKLSLLHPLLIDSKDGQKVAINQQKTNIQNQMHELEGGIKEKVEVLAQINDQMKNFQYQNSQIEAIYETFSKAFDQTSQIKQFFSQTNLVVLNNISNSQLFFRELNLLPFNLKNPEFVANYQQEKAIFVSQIQEQLKAFVPISSEATNQAFNKVEAINNQNSNSKVNQSTTTNQNPSRGTKRPPSSSVNSSSQKSSFLSENIPQLNAKLINETENLIKILEDESVFETPNRTFEILEGITTYFKWKREQIFFLKEKNEEITMLLIPYNENTQIQNIFKEIFQHQHFGFKEKLTDVPAEVLVLAENNMIMEKQAKMVDFREGGPKKCVGSNGSLFIHVKIPFQQMMAQFYEQNTDQLVYQIQLGKGLVNIALTHHQLFSKMYIVITKHQEFSISPPQPPSSTLAVPGPQNQNMNQSMIQTGPAPSPVPTYDRSNFLRINERRDVLLQNFLPSYLNLDSTKINFRDQEKYQIYINSGLKNLCVKVVVHTLGENYVVDVTKQDPKGIVHLSNSYDGSLDQRIINNQRENFNCPVIPFYQEITIFESLSQSYTIYVDIEGISENFLDFESEFYVYENQGSELNISGLPVIIYSNKIDQSKKQYFPLFRQILQILFPLFRTFEIGPFLVSSNHKSKCQLEVRENYSTQLDEIVFTFMKRRNFATFQSEPHIEIMVQSNNLIVKRLQT